MLAGLPRYSRLRLYYRLQIFKVFKYSLPQIRSFNYFIDLMASLLWPFCMYARVGPEGPGGFPSPQHRPERRAAKPLVSTQPESGRLQWAPNRLSVSLSAELKPRMGPIHPTAGGNPKRKERRKGKQERKGKSGLRKRKYPVSGP